MSLRNLRKFQATSAPSGRDGSEDEDEPDNPKTNLFRLDDQSDEDSESIWDIEQNPVSPPPNPLQSEERKQTKSKTEDLGAILDEFGEQKAIPKTTRSEKRESVLKRDAKRFNDLAETAKRFKSAPPAHGRFPLMQKRVLLTPAVPPQWPHLIDCSLTMVKLHDGPMTLFAFEVTKGYQKTQNLFKQCVESFDPSAVSAFLQVRPFHIEALFQMCAFFQLQGNYEQMEQLLQRLLYVFQISFHQEFSVLRPDVQIDYSAGIYNQLFFQTLSLQIEILGRKGCSRTALEFSKVLLGLRPILDPMGALFLVEYYTLRCKKWDYFLRLVTGFMHEFHGRGHLVWMPNILFSLALVKALQNPDPPSKISPIQIARVQEISSPEDVLLSDAGTVLLCAVAMYPAVANSVMRKISKTFPEIDTDGDSPMGNVNHVAEIYAERCSDLWKADLIAGWLKDACGLALEIASVQFRLFNLVDVVFTLDRYGALDKSSFSDTVRTVIPRELFLSH